MRDEQVQLDKVMTDFAWQVGRIDLSPTNPNLAAAITFVGGTGVELSFGFDQAGALSSPTDSARL